MPAFVFASFSAFTVYVVLFIFLTITGSRSSLNRALALLILAYVFWSFGNVFLLIAPTKEEAALWDNIGALGWTSFASAMLHFTAVFTGYSRGKPIIPYMTLLLLPPAIFLALQWGISPVSIPSQKEWYGWGTTVAQTTAARAFTIYYLCYVSLSIFMLIRHIGKSKGYERKRTAIFLGFYLPPFVAGMVTDDILPSMGYHSIPPLSIIFSTLVIAGIVYAVFRYNLLLSDRHSWLLFRSIKESTSAIKNIMDSSPYYSLVIDLSKRVHYVNRNFAAHFQVKKLPADSLIENIFKNQSYNQLLNHLDLVLKNKQSKNGEYLITKPDGTTFPALVSIASLTDNQQQDEGFVISIVDITPHKSAEARLRKARDLAKKADKAKTSLLANISHELRTPLNAIIGVSSLLAEREDNKENRETMMIIQNSGHHLIRLIDELIEFSRIESGDLTLHPQHIELAPFISEITALVCNTEQKRNIRMSVQVDDTVPKTITVDPSRLRQIIINLLSNACKFTIEGEVSVLITGSNSAISIQVSDTGPGIPEQEQKHIFSRFVQGSAAQTAGNKGTGIGLSVVRELTQLMGGNVSLDSTPGKGSTFTVTIPLNEQHHEQHQSPTSDPVQSKKDSSVN